MNVYTLNGIKDSASTTTDRLGGALSRIGYDWKPLRYRTAHSWTARRRRNREQIAASLLNQIDRGGVLVAHSFGCLLGWEMLNLHSQRRSLAMRRLFSNVFFLAPAMDRGGWDWRCLNFGRLHCVHNPHDIAILLGSITPWHPFGAAGRSGFNTNDPRISNQTAPSRRGFWNHSDPFFSGDRAKFWASEIDWLLQAEDSG